MAERQPRFPRRCVSAQGENRGQHYNDEIVQYFSYREWKKKHQPLSGVTVREILTTEDLNEGALLRIFDGVTAAFYKSDEYNSREYRYSNLLELRKAMKHKEGGTNGKAQ